MAYRDDQGDTSIEMSIEIKVYLFLMYFYFVVYIDAFFPLDVPVHFLLRNTGYSNSCLLIS